MIPPTETARLGKKREAVLEFLRKRGPAGATNVELIPVGGIRYGGRIHELRQLGFEIEQEHIKGGLHRYWLKGQMGLFA